CSRRIDRCSRAAPLLESPLSARPSAVHCPARASVVSERCKDHHSTGLWISVKRKPPEQPQIATATAAASRARGAITSASVSTKLSTSARLLWRLRVKRKLG